MKKLHIGSVIEQLDGSPQRFIEGEVERDMTLRDILVQLIPTLGGQNSDNALLLWDIGLRIRKSKDDWIDLENHDYDVLKKALEGADLLVWVRTCLAKMFEESEILYRKQETKEKDAE